MHPDQQRCTDRETAMTDLADDRRGDFERAGQGGVVLEIQLFDQGIKQIIGVIRDLFANWLAYCLFKGVIHNSCHFHSASSITGDAGGAWRRFLSRPWTTFR